MKKLLILFLFSQLNLTAQEYIPMLLEDNQWSVQDNTDFNFTYYFQFTVLGSEIINGIKYQKLFDNNEETSCRLREENGKIYRLNQNQTEAMVIDFSLEENDQFIFDRTYSPCPREYFLSIDRLQVLSTNIEFIAGANRKVLYMQGYSGNVPYSNVTEQWIEGIGSTRSFLPDNYGNWNAAEARYLFCFTQNEITTFFNNATACEEELSISEFSEDDITLYPNPLTNSSIVYLPKDGQVYNVKVYNIQGKLVKEETTKNNWIKMEFINYNSGLYFYKVFSKKQLQKTAKIVID